MTSLAIPEGGGVFLPAAVCARLRHPLMRDLQAALREQAAVAPEIVDAIGVIDAVGAAFSNKRVANVAVDVDPPRCDAMQWTTMTVPAAAKSLRISPQATRGLLERGTLHGERGPRAWRVCAESVSARLKGTKCQHSNKESHR